jgi:hypothetical protein
LNFVHITSYIFRKEKRTREEDVEDEQSQEVIFKVERSENRPLFVPFYYVVPRSQSSPEVHKSQTPEYVTWSPEQNTVVTSLNLDPVKILGESTPQDEGLYYLIVYYYSFV